MAQRRENCERAKKALAEYERARYLYAPGEGDERKVLSDEERAKVTEAMRHEVQYWCN